MPQVAEKIDERILKILGLKDTFDLDYSDYSSLLKEKLAANRIQKVLSADEDKLILDEFKRVKSKTGKFKGTKKKIGASVETKKPSSGYYKSPFAKEQVKRQQTVKPNTKVTALSTYVDKTSGQKIQPGALMKRDSGSLAKPLQEQSKKIAKVASILEASKKQENKIESEKKKDALKIQDEERKRATESAIESGIKLPNLTKIADPLLKPIKGLFNRILEALGWITLGWLIDKGITWIEKPENKQKIDNLSNWFNETGEKIASPENQEKVDRITKFLRNHWLAIFGTTGILLLWSNGLVRATAKISAKIGKGIFKIVGITAKVAAQTAKLALKNPKAAAAIAAGSAALYLKNKDKIDPVLGDVGSKASDFVSGGIEASKTAYGAGQKFVDAGDKLFKVGDYAEEQQLNTGGVSGFKSGGMVPVKLTRGEVVVPPTKARSIGYDKLYAMNSLGNGGMPFNMGGGVKVIPGRGPNVDTVSDRIPAGSFVLQRPAVDAMGGPKAFRGYNSGGAVSVPYSYAQSKLGADQKTWDIFRNTIAKIESGGRYNVAGGSGGHYDGRYQLGAAAKKDAARLFGIKNPGHGPAARAAFRSDPNLQEKLFAGYTAANDGYLSSEPKYKGKTVPQKLQILGYAHNQGWNGASNWLRTGKVGADGFGTKGTKYTDALAKAFKDGKVPNVPSDIADTNTPSPVSQVQSASGISGSSPLDFFSLTYKALDALSGKTEATDVTGEKKNSGGIIQHLNAGGYAGGIQYFSSNDGRTNKILKPGKTYSFKDTLWHHGAQPGVGKNAKRAEGWPRDYTLLDGTDLASSPNSKIPIPVDGEIVSKMPSPGGGYGNNVLVRTALGPMLFAHFDKFGNYKDGEKVKAGTIMGKQGNTPGGMADHLHLNASEAGHEAFINFITSGKAVHGGVSSSVEVIPGQAPGQESSATDSTSEKHPLNFFSTIYETLDALEKSSSTTSTASPSTVAAPTTNTKLKENITKINVTPPSKIRPKSTSSIETTGLSPDVVQSGKKTQESSVESKLPKPTQQSIVPQVPSSDSSTVTKNESGFNWSYASYYGL